MINIQMLNSSNKVKDWRKIAADIINALKSDVSLKEETLKDIEGSAVYNPNFNLIAQEAEITLTLNSSSDTFTVELRNGVTTEIDISELDSDEIHTFDVEGSWSSNVDENVGYAVEQHAYNASDFKTAELEDNYYNENGRDLVIVKYDITSGNVTGTGGVLNVKAYANSSVVKITPTLSDNSLADKILQINLLKTFSDETTEVEAIDLTPVTSFVNSNSIKSVKTELEDVIETTTEPVNEVIFNESDFIRGIMGSISIVNSNNVNIYDTYSDDNLTELNTNETFTSSQFLINTSKTTGFYIRLHIEYQNSVYGDVYEYNVASNMSNDDPPIEITNSPYTAGDTPGSISISELPSVGQSKDFYPTMVMSFINNIYTYEEYTGTDIVFTITNIDGTNYTLSFIWNKTGEITTTTKSLKTTVTKNDNTEVVTTNPISGLLQNVTFNIEEKIGNVTVASSKEYYSWIMIGDENGSDSLDQ